MQVEHDPPPGAFPLVGTVRAHLWTVPHGPWTIPHLTASNRLPSLPATRETRQMIQSVQALSREISSCSFCAEHLPLGPRPITQFSASATILVIGQAPGTKVHASGIPWQDDSGHRLRRWMGIDERDFYDPARVALMPMGFCYPGKKRGGDAPPRPECAPRWHDRILGVLPEGPLTLLVGTFAQEHYSPKEEGKTLLERVRGFDRVAPALLALPHPSWRSVGWQRRNPWFEMDLLPVLRSAVRQRLCRP